MILSLFAMWFRKLNSMPHSDLALVVRVLSSVVVVLLVLAAWLRSSKRSSASRTTSTPIKDRASWKTALEKIGRRGDGTLMSVDGPHIPREGKDKLRIEGLARWRMAAIVIAAGLFAMLLAFGITVYINLFGYGATSTMWVWAFSVQFLISIGTSILASVAFYLLYARLLERAVLEEVTESSVMFAADYVSRLYSAELDRMVKRFDRMLPSKTYDESNISERQKRCSL